MRKNRMMRAASALLVAVLLTTSTISGTFAKYVTTSEGSDTARVAKWGVELQVAGNLFADSYINEISNETDLASLAVNSDNGDDVVAPGTINEEGFTFSINGKPEVAGQIRIDRLIVQNIYLKEGTYAVMVPVPAGTVTAANFDEFEDLYVKNGNVYVEAEAYTTAEYFTLEDKVTLDANYYPVKFNLKGETKYDAPVGTDTDTLVAAANEIAKAIDSAAAYNTEDASGKTTFTINSTKKFNPNTNLADVIKLGTERLVWAWAFTGQNDGADTILGNLMEGSNVIVVKLVDVEADKYGALEDADYCLDLQFDFAITVEQIDEAAGA